MAGQAQGVAQGMRGIQRVAALVGNEDVDNRITELPNVLLSRNFQSNISRDLAIIQISCAFMGMASGPCNMAIFSEIPYVIYKNPDHDAEQMALELGKAGAPAVQAAEDAVLP